MKNKESFLKELQARISVLEEAEQQDILAEYAQHIDLRAAGGLTEEEAIRDFGDLDQLTAEILSAYHVRPGYQQSGEKKRLSLPNPWPAVRRGAARAGGFLRRLGGGIADGFRKLWGAIRGVPARISARFGLDKDFFEEPETEMKIETEPAADAEAGAAEDVPETDRERRAEGPDPCPQSQTEHEEEDVKDTKKKGEALAAVGGFFRRLGRGACRLCRSAAWLAWNLFLLLCALPFACLGLAALICLGTLVVLMAQGYPLTGVMLCCLGGAACCVGILGLGSGLIWHRARPAAQAVDTAAQVEPVTGLIHETAAEAEREEAREDAE